MRARTPSVQAVVAHSPRGQTQNAGGGGVFPPLRERRQPALVGQSKAKQNNAFWAAVEDFLHCLRAVTNRNVMADFGKAVGDILGIRQNILSVDEAGHGI